MTQSGGGFTGGGGSVQLGKRIFAPYVDVLLWPTLDASVASAATGTKWFTLAFITDDGRGNPAWGGSVALDQQWYMSIVTKLRAMGGDVSVNPYLGYRFFRRSYRSRVGFNKL